MDDEQKIAVLRPICVRLLPQITNAPDPARGLCMVMLGVRDGAFDSAADELEELGMTAASALVRGLKERTR